MIFHRGAQCPEGTDRPAWCFPDHPRLAPDYGLPLASVVSLPLEHHLLHAVTELDVDPLGQKAPLVGSGCPGKVRVEELTERDRRGGIIAEGFQQRGKELLGGIGSQIGDARGSLVDQETRQKVQDRGPRPGREPLGLGQWRDRRHGAVLQGLEVAQLLHRHERNPVLKEPEPIRLSPERRVSRARLDPDPPAVGESQLGPTEPVGLIPARDGQQCPVTIELDEAPRRPAGGTLSRAGDGAMASDRHEPARVIRSAQSCGEPRGDLGIMGSHCGIPEPDQEALPDDGSHAWMMIQ